MKKWKFVVEDLHKRNTQSFKLSGIVIVWTKFITEGWGKGTLPDVTSKGDKINTKP
jgi:hypothetical protein